MTLLRSLGRLGGLALLVLAFLAGAYEMASHGMVKDRPPVMPAWQVAVLNWPDALARFRASVIGQFGAGTWDGIVFPLLKLPGWLLFGLPGGVLLYVSRRRRAGDAIDEQSLFLYDELSRAAKEDGFDEEEADIYTDTVRDIRAGWKAEGEVAAADLHDDREATPPYRPPPTDFGRR